MHGSWLHPDSDVAVYAVLDIKLDPVSPAPKANIFVIFLTTSSNTLVSRSLLPSVFPSLVSLCSSSTYLSASKGLMLILLIEMLIFSRGVRALVSIEYMKMMVEKIRRIVMKQLRAMLIMAVMRDIPLPLKVMK